MVISDELKKWLTYITIGILLIFMMVESVSSSMGTSLAILMTMLFGIPHGATDHILFRHINKDFGKGFMYRFLARYLLLMGIFILTWWILPGLALIIFLTISAYHFGQSHWSDLELSRSLKNILYFSWGGSLLLGLLMLNHTETLPIINSMIEKPIAFSNVVYIFVPFLLLLINIALILYLFNRKKLSAAASFKEVTNLFLFGCLFVKLPLLIGFAFYFVFWHSTLSIRDQINYFKKFRPNYGLKNFVLQSLPFTILAFIGIGGLSVLSSYEIASEGWIGQFFIMISIVTLPHSLLMDMVLEQAPDQTITDYNNKEKNRAKPFLHTKIELQEN